MKKLLFPLLFFIFSYQFSIAQNPLVKQWDYRFGGTDAEQLTCFQQTRDGGYILGGSSSSIISGDKTQASWGGSDYWIVKTDSLGIKQWDKDFGGTNADYLSSIQQTADGGYILGGSSYSGISGDKTQPLQGNYDYWIVKTDSLGSKQWDKDFGGTDAEELFSIQQTADGGYILGGLSFSGISGDKSQATWGSYDYWIVKTDSLGIKQWDKDFGGIGQDWLYSLQQTADGGYILGGYSNSGISGNKSQASWGTYDLWIVKTDSLGIKQWDKDFGGTDDEVLYSLQQTADGGYMLGGTSYSGISGDKTQATWGSYDYWIVKTDASGNKQWDKDFGGIGGEELWKVSQTKDGGYLLSGDSYSPISGDKTESNLGGEQIWVVKTNSLGSKQWDKTIFTDGHDEIGLAIQTRDGCYTMANYSDGGIAGYKTQTAWGGYDYWLIKFCDTICTAIAPTIMQTGDTLSVYQSYASYQWFYGSVPIAGATNYFYVATQSGNYNIEVTDNSGCTAGAGIINVIAGLLLANGYWQLAVFPNPSTNTFTIKNISSSAPALLQIVNAVGEIVYTETLVGKNEYVIHPNLAAGFYFAEITCSEKKIVSKLVIEK